MKKRRTQSGFTIIEMLIATVVFSLVLLILSFGIIQIGRAYYKGTIQSRTQETARNIIDEISRGIQYSGETIMTTQPDSLNPASCGPSYSSAKQGCRYGFCINGIGYDYIMDMQLDHQPVPDPANQRPYVLISYPVSQGCNLGGYTVQSPAAASAFSGAKERLGFGMKLIELDVEGSNNIYTITVGVATGQRDLFSPAAPSIGNTCKGSTGNAYCATSILTTTVERRVH